MIFPKSKRWILYTTSRLLWFKLCYQLPFLLSNNFPPDLSGVDGIAPVNRDGPLREIDCEFSDRIASVNRGGPLREIDCEFSDRIASPVARRTREGDWLRVFRRDCLACGSADPWGRLIVSFQTGLPRLWLGGPVREIDCEFSDGLASPVARRTREGDWLRVFRRDCLACGSADPWGRCHQTKRPLSWLFYYLLIPPSCKHDVEIRK